jgi:hypothetical protein
MISFNINWLAVVVGAVLNMAIGAAWYGAYAKPWLAGIGKTYEEVQAEQTPRDYAVALLNSLLMSFMLANVIRWAGATTLLGGLVTGLVMWVGFTGFSFAANHAFEGRALNMWWINSGMYLVGLIVMGAILGVWQ